MKTSILIILACICTNIYSQPGVKARVGTTTFAPISEKIKKLSSASSLAKMKPSTGFILSPAKMTSANNWSLHFRKPDYVTPQVAEFNVNDESTLNAPTFVINFPANMGGIYVVEMNIGLFHMGKNFDFKVSCNGVVQVISLIRDDTNNNEYYDSKLVFAVTVPNSAFHLKVLTKSAPWQFRNCEITPMK